MKKILTLLLVIIMSMAMVACGEEASLPEANDDGGGDQHDNGNEVPGDIALIEEQVLVNQNGIIITATAIEDSWMGPELKVRIENNYDQPITVQARNTSMNGFMLEPIFSAGVMPGKKANDELTFSKRDLEKCGIEAITDIEFNFVIINSETWDRILETDLVTIRTSLAESYSQHYDASGDVLYDGLGIKIIYQGTGYSIFGPEFCVYVENNSTGSITVQVRNTSVNGYMIDPIFSCDVMPGKKAMDALTFFASDFEDNDIEHVNEIELSFHIFNSDSWDTIVDTAVITITNP